MTRVALCMVSRACSRLKSSATLLESTAVCTQSAERHRYTPQPKTCFRIGPELFENMHQLSAQYVKSIAHCLKRHERHLHEERKSYRIAFHHGLCHHERLERSKLTPLGLALSLCLTTAHVARPRLRRHGSPLVRQRHLAHRDGRSAGLWAERQYAYSGLQL